MITPRLVVACAGFVLLWGSMAARAWAGGIPAETLKEIKAATVFVKVQFSFRGKTLPASGSGFVMRVDGETGYIATNHHVLHAPDDLPGVTRVGPIVLVFHSGTAKEKEVHAEIVATDSSRDLAILKVTNFKDLPRPIQADPKLELLETMTVYAFGFPFGQALSLTKGNPAMTVGRGSISSIRNDEFGSVKVIQIDGDLNPGNSGGPVVDEKGRLVGVAVAKLTGTRIGMAIPPQELAKMLLGRVGGISLTTLKTDKDGAEVRVRVSLIDPLRRMKGVSILYVPTAELKQEIKLSKEGKFPKLEGGTKVDLKIDKDEGEALFRLPSSGKSRMAITFQTAYTNADGETIYTAALVHAVDFNEKTITGTITDADPRDPLDKKPYHVHRITMKAGQRFTIEMRADPKELDPFLKIKDADGKVLAQDDDSGGGLNARIVFTAPRDGEYQIIATIFRGKGPYVLAIREDLGPAANQPVHEIGKDGLSIDAQLTRDDPTDTALTDAPRKIVSVRLKAGQRYVIDLKSKDFDAFLRLENAQGKELARDDDSGGGLDARIRFVAPADGVYHIIATSLNRRPGSFLLTVRAEP